MEQFLDITTKTRCMKQLIWIAGLAISLASCGEGSNGNTSATGSDSASNGTLDGAHAGATHVQPLDTVGIGRKSMMQLMQRNMDEMRAIPSTGNPDNDFAALMKVHHMGALQMAQMEVTQGSDPKIRDMARRMMEGQQQEIAQFNTFLSGHNAHGGGDAFYKEVMGSMNSMKMDMDHSGSVDKQFVQIMIPHHQGAVDMSKAYLKSGAHEETLKAMAGRIIADQQREIGEMQAWLKAAR